MDKLNARLYRAIDMGLPISVEKSILDGADANSNFYGKYLIQHAAEFGNTEIVKILIKNGADSNGCLPFTKTALTSSCEIGNYEAILALLMSGADPNSDRGSPLISSCAIRDTETVKALIQAGADPNLNGLLLISSPLETICTLNEGWRQALNSNPKWFMRIVEIERKFYQKKEINKKKKQEVEKVYQDFLDAGTEIICVLINAGADPNKKPPMGCLPLIAAIESENIGAFLALICRGADIDLKIDRDYSPRDLMNQKELFVLLSVAESFQLETKES
jgi:hypothetical protein